MFSPRAASLAVLFSLLCALGLPGARPVVAGVDTCAEPNGEPASACFLGAEGPAAGFLDTAEDVDGYRIELPGDSMVVATLGSLPADYGLRLLLPDSNLLAEATEPGVADKVVQADGLPAGTYFLLVVSVRGESNPDQPYVLSVSYPASIVLATPAAPDAPSGAAQGAYGYIPPPARTYGLQMSDFGGGFREVARQDTEDGRGFANRIVSLSSVPVQDFWFSADSIGMIDTAVFILPYGENEQIAATLNKVLDTWRGKGINVQPAVGWGSEQVYSYANAIQVPDGRVVMHRGIALRHRNAVVFMEMLGFAQYSTWDAVSGLMRKVEQRIHAAQQ
jgi:hypothetical protein